MSVWTLYWRGEVGQTQSWTNDGTLPVEWEWLAARADRSQKVCPEEGHIAEPPCPAKNNGRDRTRRWHGAGDWHSQWRGYGDGSAEGNEGWVGDGDRTERHFMSRGRLKNVGIWPRHWAARELGLSGGIRGDWIEMSWSSTLQLSHTHTSPAWHSARPFCGSNALKLQTPPHPQCAAMERPPTRPPNQHPPPPKAFVKSGMW